MIFLTVTDFGGQTLWLPKTRLFRQVHSPLLPLARLSGEWPEEHGLSNNLLLTKNLWPSNLVLHLGTSAYAPKIRDGQ